jgi:PEGA domain
VTRGRVPVAAVLVVIAALAPGAPAFADDPPPPPAADTADKKAADAADKKAEARAHFDKARALAESGSWSAALAEFLASRRLYATWGNTLGAASSLQKLGRFDEALDLFEILLKEDGDTLAADVRAAAQRQVVELRGLTGTVEISGAEIGAAITIDGRDRGDYPAPGPLRVAAGSHLVRVSKQGFEPFETRADVAGGQTAQVVAHLRAVGESGRLKVSEEGGRALDVLVDGDLVGKTPWEGSLAVGEHVVLLRGEGLLGTQPVSVPVRRDRTAPLTLRAEELTARIRVEPVPVNASVAIDAIVVARGIWEGRLRAGAHKVEVAAEGFSAGARDVTLERDKQAVVAVTLQRDPRSPFWRKPPRPSHVVLEIDGAVPVVPSFGGDVAGGCAGACSVAPGFGGYGVIRVGYELGSGFGFGASVGYLYVQEGVNGRAAQLQPVGLPKTDPGTLDDTLAIRNAGLAGLWAGYSVGERFVFHGRVGAGALLASFGDTRTGTFTPQLAGPRYTLGPLLATGFTPFVYGAPEVRAGLRFGEHVELSLGVEALVLVALSQPSWDGTRQLNAGADGIGTLPSERLVGRVVFMVAPGVGARYDF